MLYINELRTNSLVAQLILTALENTWGQDNKKPVLFLVSGVSGIVEKMFGSNSTLKQFHIIDEAKLLKIIKFFRLFSKNTIGSFKKINEITQLIVHLDIGDY